MFPLFATGDVYTSGKFAAGVDDTGGNMPPALLTHLPPVSTTLAKLVEKFASGIVDTCGGVVDTGSTP